VRIARGLPKAQENMIAERMRIFHTHPARESQCARKPYAEYTCECVFRSYRGGV
jgi:hypothetical protein